MRKNKKNTKRHRKGGKLLGEGKYGCVTTPTVLCKDMDIIGSNIVSKLFYDQKELEEELRQITKVKGLPDHEIYTVNTMGVYVHTM